MSLKHRRPRSYGKPEFGRGLRRHTTNELIKPRVMRAIRRKMASDGLILDGNRSPRFQFDWEYGNLSGSVFSDSRSEARALIKKNLGISKKHRLPAEVTIERFNNPDYLKEVQQINVNLQASFGPPTTGETDGADVRCDA